MLLRAIVSSRSAAASSVNARDQAARLTQIDRQKILVEDMRRALQFHEPGKRGLWLGFRQKNVNSIGGFQRPAALRDQHAGHDPFAQVSGRVQER